MNSLISEEVSIAHNLYPVTTFCRSADDFQIIKSSCSPPRPKTTSLPQKIWARKTRCRHNTAYGQNVWAYIYCQFIISINHLPLRCTRPPVPTDSPEIDRYSLGGNTSLPLIRLFQVGRPIGRML